MSQQYERIMVAIDGSYESELAFIKGVHVAKRNNAQLLLVHVIDTRALQSVATFDSYIYEKLEDEAKAVLADFERQAREAGLTKIRKVIEFGNPKSLLAVDILIRKMLTLLWLVPQVSILLNACLLVHLLNTFSVTQKLTCSLFVTLKKHFSHLSQKHLWCFSHMKKNRDPKSQFFFCSIFQTLLIQTLLLTLKLTGFLRPSLH